MQKQSEAYDKAVQYRLLPASIVAAGRCIICIATKTRSQLMTKQLNMDYDEAWYNRQCACQFATLPRSNFYDKAQFKPDYLPGLVQPVVCPNLQRYPEAIDSLTKPFNISQTTTKPGTIAAGHPSIATLWRSNWILMTKQLTQAE